MAAHRGRRTSRSAGRKTVRRIWVEDAGQNQPKAVRRNEQRPLRSAFAASKRSSDAGGARERKQPCDDEVRTLNPPTFAEVQKADGNSPNIESGASEELKKQHSDE